MEMDVTHDDDVILESTATVELPAGLRVSLLLQR